MVVTHSPQVTSKGHNHYLIEKQDIQNKTISKVTELNINQRVEEIARMVLDKPLQMKLEKRSNY